MPPSDEPNAKSRPHTTAKSHWGRGRSRHGYFQIDVLTKVVSASLCEADGTRPNRPLFCLQTSTARVQTRASLARAERPPRLSSCLRCDAAQKDCGIEYFRHVQYSIYNSSSNPSLCHTRPARKYRIQSSNPPNSLSAPLCSGSCPLSLCRASIAAFRL